MAAGGIGSVVGRSRSVYYVAKELDNANGCLVVKGCPITEGGVSTVNAECGEDEHSYSEIVRQHFGFLGSARNWQGHADKALVRRV